MTVLDQLRAADEAQQRVASLQAACVHARDVLEGDLTGEALRAELERVLTHLAAVIWDEPASQNPPSNEEPKQEPRRPATKRKVKKSSPKKSTAKAARRSPRSPAAATAGQAVVKACATCKTPKPLDRFAKANRSRDGLTRDCVDCREKAGKPASATGGRRPADPAPDATVTSITASTDDLVAVCPVHSVVAREPIADVTVPHGAWLFKARSNHRLNDRCEQPLRLSEQAA